jgi:hypothetical protein
VCGPATTAAQLGLFFALQPVGALKRVFSALLGFAGVAAIYLSHVRTMILIVAGMSLVYAVMLWLRRERARAGLVLGVAGGMLVGALFFAAMLGGESIIDRFSTLFEEDPTSVFYKSGRGAQLQYDTQAYLWDYPLGAGLGRWGMMRLYFGNEDNVNSPPLWAEVQWPAWVLDGGIIVLLLYGLALLHTAVYEYKVCRTIQSPRLANIAVVIFAANAGVVALTLGFTPFTTQVGLQYWFLAGLLHGASLLPEAYGDTAAGIA